MFENIIFAVLVIIAISAGIWVYWIDNHDSKSEDSSVEKEG